MQKPTWFSISFFKDWALWTLSLASGGPTVLIAVFFFLQGKEPPKSGVLTVLGACSLVAAWVAGLRERRLRIESEKRLENAANQRPRLKVNNADFYETTRFSIVPIGREGSGQVLTGPIPISCLILKIENDPILATTEASVAKQVGATLIFHFIEEALAVAFPLRVDGAIQHSQPISLTCRSTYVLLTYLSG
jgi:hypothetical protein